MLLSKEIEEKSREIKTDGYPMSIGELINLYKDGDLTVFPEFQRYFRWNLSQKSNLIESILLGIPIPPIFVSQDKDGKWDIVDGLQRISSILEFVGILKDKDGKLYPPSTLIGTKFLPSLDGKKWEDEDENISFSETERRIVKRRKLNIIIIDSINNPTAKYELFQRLNTNGSELKDQEIRNCLMIMMNVEFYKKIEKICNIAAFKNITSLSERLIKEQYDKELVIRYLVARNKDLTKVNSNEDMGKYLTDKTVEIINDQNYNIEKDLNAFEEVINLLNECLSINSFKRWNDNKGGKFEGQFLLSAYETIILGLSKNIKYWKDNKDELEITIKNIYSNSKYKSSTSKGKRPILRFKELSELSMEIFANEN